MSEDASAAPPEAPAPSNPYHITHMPRKKAKPPSIPQNLMQPAGSPPGPQPQQASPSPSTSASTSASINPHQLAKATEVLQQGRVGPYLVKYSCFSGVGALAYTYLNGFAALARKDRQSWVNTFRHRIFILGPLIAMYATANNVVPFPFKESVEKALGRQALSMVDLVTAKQAVRLAKEDQ